MRPLALGAFAVFAFGAFVASVDTDKKTTTDGGNPKNDETSSLIVVDKKGDYAGARKANQDYWADVIEHETPNFNPLTGYQQCQTSGALLPFVVKKDSFVTSIETVAKSKFQAFLSCSKNIGKSNNLKKLHSTVTFTIYFPDGKYIIISGEKFLGCPYHYMDMEGDHKKTIIMGRAKTDCGESKKTVAEEHDWRTHCVGGLKKNRPDGVIIVINWGAYSCCSSKVLKNHYVGPMSRELGYFIGKFVILSSVYIIAQGIAVLIMMSAAESAYQKHVSKAKKGAEENPMVAEIVALDTADDDNKEGGKLKYATYQPYTKKIIQFKSGQVGSGVNLGHIIIDLHLSAQLTPPEKHSKPWHWTNFIKPKKEDLAAAVITNFCTREKICKAEKIEERNGEKYGDQKVAVDFMTPDPK